MQLNPGVFIGREKSVEEKGVRGSGASLNGLRRDAEHDAPLRREKRIRFANDAKKLSAISLVVLAGILPMKAQRAHVKLEWNDPKDPTIESYNIYYSTSHAAYTNVVGVPGGSGATNTVITGLVAGVTYYFAGTALRGAQEMTFTEEGSYLIPTNTVPPSPVNLRIIGYNSKLGRGLEAANPSYAMMTFSPSVWSMLDPFLDSGAEAVGATYRQKPETMLRF